MLPEPTTCRECDGERSGLSVLDRFRVRPRFPTVRFAPVTGLPRSDGRLPLCHRPRLPPQEPRLPCFQGLQFPPEPATFLP